MLLVASGSVHHVNACDLMERSEVLRKYLSDGQKELEALHALERMDLLERMERPHSECLVPPRLL